MVLKMGVKNMNKLRSDAATPQTKNFRSYTYGVIGVCGIVGNLVARMVHDHGCNVIGTDSRNEEECEFKYTLLDYDFPVYLSSHPEIFFEESDIIIPPPSLKENSDLYKKIELSGKKILGVEDCLKLFKPEKPVICITGTNGKTTTTSLLKDICRSGGLKPTEHSFKNLQGNIDYIPPLQARLRGDVAILETGTFGKVDDLKLMIERSRPDYGILTNITPDHLNNEQDFINYASIKGEFVKYFKNKPLIINSDDPTVFSLVNTPDHTGKVLTFGVDSETTNTASKICWCGNSIIIEETISGSGYYECECGLTRPQPDYLAFDIDESRGNFKLRTPKTCIDVQTNLIGLHNVYNIIGAIAAAQEFFKIPLERIIDAVKTFEGVPGRMEHMYKQDGTDIIIDYGHNPAGIQTVLRELKKVYDNIAVVITVSSESGETGDAEILKNAYEIADFVVPASYSSRLAAENSEYMFSDRIILTNKSPMKFKKGTLGATPDQVIEGLKKGLECDTDAVICLGEAAFKYKEYILKLREYK